MLPSRLVLQHSTLTLDGRRVLAHSGGDDGFVSKMTVLPDVGVGVVLMSNCEFAPMSEAEQLLLREAIATAAA